MIPDNWRAFAASAPEGRILLALTSPTLREPWDVPKKWGNLNEWLATNPGAHVLYSPIKTLQRAYTYYVYPPKDDAQYHERGIPQTEIDATREVEATSDTSGAARFVAEILRAHIDKDGEVLYPSWLRGLQPRVKWTKRSLRDLVGGRVDELYATLAADPRVALRAAKRKREKEAAERARKHANHVAAWAQWTFGIDGRDVQGLDAAHALAERARLVVKTRAPAASRLVFYVEHGGKAVGMHALSNALAGAFDDALAAVDHAVPVLQGTRQVYLMPDDLPDASAGSAVRVPRWSRALTTGGKRTPTDIKPETSVVVVERAVLLGPRAQNVAYREGAYDFVDRRLVKVVLLKDDVAPFNPFEADDARATAALHADAEA